MLKKFKVICFGCKTNQYEAELYREELEALGLEEVDRDADICIIHTCSVTSDAEKKSKNAIKIMSKRHPRAKIFVTGCIDERNEERENLISKIFPGKKSLLHIKKFDNHTRAFIKIQDGCNNFCSYCIVPFARGRSRSRAIDDILKEVEGLSSSYKEIVFTAINISDFPNLPELIRKTTKIDGIKRIRLSSINLKALRGEFLNLFIEEEKLMPNLHIPLQSGSNLILEKMHRNYAVEPFLEKLAFLRKNNPDFTFTTDIIVGFPGEREEDFQETLKVVEKARFLKVHFFPFSMRKNTLAAKMEGQVSLEVVKEREERLKILSERVAFEVRSKFIGRRMQILMEKKIGHTANFLEVQISGTKPCVNELAYVKIIENKREGLCGVID